jgi:hypothetical protein
MFLICIILFQVLAPETNQLSQIINILAWPQWWSLFNDMDQQGHYKKKVSSIQMGFWSDLITAFKHAIKRCLNLIFEVSFQEYQKKISLSFETLTHFSFHAAINEKSVDVVADLWNSAWGYWIDQEYFVIAVSYVKRWTSITDTLFPQIVSSLE